MWHFCGYAVIRPCAVRALRLRRVIRSLYLREAGHHQHIFLSDEQGVGGVLCKPSMALVEDAISDLLDLLVEGSFCTGHTTRPAFPDYLGNRLLPLQAHAN
jgi:hypothetical protein